MLRPNQLNVIMASTHGLHYYRHLKLISQADDIFLIVDLNTDSNLESEKEILTKLFQYQH